MQSRKLNEHVEDELFNKEKREKSSDDNPVKKKKPYYRKRYKKPTEVEIIPEPVNNYLFIKGLITGLGIAGLITIITNLLTS